MELKLIETEKIKSRDFSISDRNPLQDAKLEQFITAHGQLKPLIICKSDDDDYEIIDGNRVLKVLKRLNKKQVFCIVLPQLKQIEKILYFINLNAFQIPHDEVSVSKLIALLCTEYGKFKVPYITPFSGEEVTDYINLSEFDWDKFKDNINSNQQTLFE